MGVIDEHWCNQCHKPLQKGEDDYFEFEFPTLKELRREACPECRSINVHARRKKRPKWRCAECKKEFSEPVKISVEEKIRKTGLICMDCINKKKELKQAIDEVVKAGNPVCVPILECLYWQKCPAFSPAKEKPVRCKHIAISEDKIYCKRAHAGTLELPVEKAELLRTKQKYVTEFIEEAVKNLDPAVAAGVKSAFQLETQGMWIPPSTVVSIPKKEEVS